MTDLKILTIKGICKQCQRATILCADCWRCMYCHTNHKEVPQQ